MKIQRKFEVYRDKLESANYFHEAEMISRLLALNLDTCSKADILDTIEEHLNDNGFEIDQGKK